GEIRIGLRPMETTDPFDELSDRELAATFLQIASLIADRLARRAPPMLESELGTPAGLIPARGRGRPKGGPTSDPETWAPPRHWGDCGKRVYRKRAENRMFCRDCGKRHRQPGMDFSRHCEECGKRVYTTVAEDRHKCRDCEKKHRQPNMDFSRHCKECGKHV